MFIKVFTLEKIEFYINTNMIEAIFENKILIKDWDYPCMLCRSSIQKIIDYLDSEKQLVN